MGGRNHRPGSIGGDKKAVHGRHSWGPGSLALCPPGQHCSKPWNGKGVKAWRYGRLPGASWRKRPGETTRAERETRRWRGRRDRGKRPSDDQGQLLSVGPAGEHSQGPQETAENVRLSGQDAQRRGITWAKDTGYAVLLASLGTGSAVSLTHLAQWQCHPGQGTEGMEN